jgi:ribosomal protein S3
MISLLKKKVNYNKEIEDFTNAFVEMKGINPLLKDIQIEDLQSGGIKVTLHCGFPHLMIGVDGKTVREYSSNISGYLNKTVLAEVKRFKVRKND